MFWGLKGNTDLCWVGWLAGWQPTLHSQLENLTRSWLALGPNACPEDAGSPLRRLSVDRDDDGEDGDDGGGENVDMVYWCNGGDGRPLFLLTHLFKNQKTRLWLKKCQIGWLRWLENPLCWTLNIEGQICAGGPGLVEQIFGPELNVHFFVWVCYHCIGMTDRPTESIA